MIGQGCPFPVHRARQRPGDMLLVPPGWLRMLRLPLAPAAAPEAALLHWQRLTPRAAATDAVRSNSVGAATPAVA